MSGQVTFKQDNTQALGLITRLSADLRDLATQKKFFTVGAPAIIQMPPIQGQKWEESNLGKVHQIINAYVELGVLDRKWRIRPDKLGREINRNGELNGTEKSVEALQKALGVAPPEDNKGQFEKLTLEAVEKDLQKRKLPKEKEIKIEDKVATTGHTGGISDAMATDLDQSFRRFDEQLAQFVRDRNYVKAAGIYEKLGKESEVFNLVKKCVEDYKLEEAKTIAKLLKGEKLQKDANKLIASAEKPQEDASDEFGEETEVPEYIIKAKGLIADNKYYEAARLYYDANDKNGTIKLANDAEKSGNISDALKIYEMIGNSMNVSRLQRVIRQRTASENAQKEADQKQKEAEKAALSRKAEEEVEALGALIEDLTNIMNSATVNIDGQTWPVYENEKKYFENNVLNPLKEKYAKAQAAIKANPEEAIELSKSYTKNGGIVEAVAINLLKAKTALNDRWSNYNKRKRDYDEAERTDLEKYNDDLKERREKLIGLNVTLETAVNSFRQGEYSSDTQFKGVASDSDNLAPLEGLPAEAQRPKIKIAMGHGEDNPDISEIAYDPLVQEGDRLTRYNKYVKSLAEGIEVSINFHFIEFARDEQEGKEFVLNPDLEKRREMPYAGVVDPARHAIYEVETYKRPNGERGFRVKKDEGGNTIKIADLIPGSEEGIPQLSEESQTQGVVDKLAQTRKEPEFKYTFGVVVFPFATVK